MKVWKIGSTWLHGSGFKRGVGAGTRMIINYRFGNVRGEVVVGGF